VGAKKRTPKRSNYLKMAPSRRIAFLPLAKTQNFQFRLLVCPLALVATRSAVRSSLLPSVGAKKRTPKRSNYLKMAPSRRIAFLPLANAQNLLETAQILLCLYPLPALTFGRGSVVRFRLEGGDIK